jgi:hypothetical protein
MVDPRKTWFGLTAIVAGLAAFGFLAPHSAYAGPALNALQLGIANELEDDDWETGFAGAGNILDPGDLLFGMAEVTAINGTAGTALGATFTAVFAIKVVTKVVVDLPGGGPAEIAQFTFGPPTDADWATLAGLVGGWPARNNSNTMMIVYEDIGVDPPIGAPFFIDPSTFSVASVTGDGTPLWEFGHVGMVGEVWTATSVSPSGFADDLDAADLAGSFDARLNVSFTYPAVGSLILLRVYPDPAFPLFAKDPTGTNANAAQLHITGGSFTKAGGTTPFPVKSDADLWIVPTPEPSSLVLLAGMGLLSAAGYARRFGRRKSAA